MDPCELGGKSGDLLVDGGNSDRAPRPVGGLVDKKLSPAAEQAKASALTSLIEAEGRRIVASFLGCADYEKLQRTMTTVLANILLECLPAFVRERGGQVVWSIRMDGARGEALNAIQEVVNVGGKVCGILREGYLFLYFPNERVVVSAEQARKGYQLVTRACVRSNVDSAALWQQWEDYAREHNYLRGQAFFADGEIIERKRAYTWDDILLPEETKRTVRTHVETFLRHRLRLRGLGVKTRRGLILAGPPGTGKTLLGKVLADTLDASFMWVSPGHVCDAESFKSILSVARFVAPAVVFLEDLDLFGQERDLGCSTGLGELMNQLDGAIDNEDIVTIATTNRLEVIEKALRNRPGRFDRVVKLEAMDRACRQEMLAKLLARAVISDRDMGYLVEATDDYTGAQLEELANTLYILAVESDNSSSRNGDGETGCISVNRDLIDAALEEVKFERKGKLGFHVA